MSFIFSFSWIKMNDCFIGPCEQTTKPSVMENKTSPRYEILEKSDYATADHSGQLTDSPYSGILSNDILVEDFPEDELFVLREEYVMMEEEYVMWEGTAPCGVKNKSKSFKDVFQEELVLPEDDSLHHLEGYYTLKTGNQPKSHY